MSFRLILQFCLAIGLIFAVFFFLTVDQKMQWKSVWDYRQLFLNGWLMTVVLSLASLGLSLLIGLITALLKRSTFRFISLIAKIYIEIVRGTPLLVQILFFYYVIAHHIGLDNRYVAGVIILSLFNGAYIAEIIRGGVDSISATQLESARAIGLSRLQAYRFVIFPQAIRQMLPPLAGQFASIIKDSSLLSVIGINELTNNAQQINSATYSTLETFLPLAAAYLILTLPISLWSKKLEDKYRYDS